MMGWCKDAHGCGHFSIGNIDITNLNKCDPDYEGFWDYKKPWKRRYKNWFFQKVLWKWNWKWFLICGFEVSIG